MWAKKLIEKKPFKLLAVALANKMARIATDRCGAYGETTPHARRQRAVCGDAQKSGLILNGVVCVIRASGSNSPRTRPKT
jgi:hypothetical protein